MAEKTCRHCERVLPLDEFPKNKRTRDGKCSWCKECHNEARRRTMAKPGKREEYRQKEIEAGRSKPPPEPMPCRQCGEVFQPSRNGNIYCSTECMAAAGYDRAKARRLAEQRREWDRRRYEDDVRLFGRARADQLARERAARRAT